MAKNGSAKLFEYVCLVKDNFDSLQIVIKKGNLETILNLYKFFAIIGLYE